MPRVSIGMPLYNGERYLRCAIESLLDQTYTDFELLIADNCSTDSSLEIAQDYALRDSRIRIVEREKNQGAIDNFNFVFNESSGELFKWAAVDDICRPRFLEKCVSALDENPEAVWSHSTSDKIDSAGESLLQKLTGDDPLVQRVDGKLAWKNFPRPGFASPSPAARFGNVLLGTNWCVDSYGVFRRSALQKTRLFINVYGAEKVLIGELSLLGKYVHVDEDLFSQRIHDAASSSLTSHKEQQEYTGAKKRSFLRTRLALCKAHLNSVYRHRIGITEKAKAHWAVMRYMLQMGKWSKMIKDFWYQRGLGGGGKRLLEKTQSPSH